jgi:hypothetical protein
MTYGRQPVILSAPGDAISFQRRGEEIAQRMRHDFGALTDFYNLIAAIKTVIRNDERRAAHNPR